MFAGIESGQPWPHELLTFKWVPLSKSSTGEAVDVSCTRLISVSSHVLRTWSSARARQGTDFLSRVVPSSVQGGLLDAPSIKCFDTLDAAVLCDVAIAKGFMPSVFGPFKQLAMSHTRVLTMQNWKGPATAPKRGLPHGDGL
eukprot:3100321-Amphidinium_carterae.3